MSSSARSRRRFTPEFKAEAVEMVKDIGGNIVMVAREPGIYDSSLGNWVPQPRAEKNGAPTTKEREEIRDLRRELDRTRRERDILANPAGPACRGL